MSWHTVFTEGLNEFLKQDPENYNALSEGRIWLYIGSLGEKLLKDVIRPEYIVKDEKMEPLSDCDYTYAGVKIVVVRMSGHFRFSR